MFNTYKLDSKFLPLFLFLFLGIYFVSIMEFASAQNSNTFPESLPFNTTQQKNNNNSNDIISVIESNDELSLDGTGNSSIDLFKEARQQYLSAWNYTNFHSFFDTFIEQGSDKGYGIYQAYKSNVFEPGESIVLYLEPVGFSHKQVFDENGDILYQVNLTATIIVSDIEGNELGKVDGINTGIINSHNKITETFLVLTLEQNPSFPEGEYNIKYIVYDGSSGKTFEITKPIRIAQVVSAGIA